MTLLELTLATAIGALLLSGLHALVGVALQSGAEGHRTNDMAYQGQFAMDRMAEKLRTSAPKQLTTPAAGTTGDWFTAPLMYCRNAVTKQLIETTTADTSCSGTAVIAQNVSAFTATLPLMGPLDRHSGIITLTQTDAAGHVLSLTMQLRLGGGTQ